MEQLLQPINEEQPCGEYLKGNRSLYRALRNSFNQAQSSYRQLMESPQAMLDEELIDNNSVSWSELADLCQSNLTELTKDVEIFCWLITAQIYTSKPLENIGSCLEVFSKLLSEYWSDLHPKPPVEKLKATDESGQLKEWTEGKIKPLLQLVGESDGTGLLYMPLQNIPLVGGVDYSQYYQAEKSGELAQLKEQSIVAFNEQPDSVTATILALGRILDCLETIEQTISEHCRAVGAVPVNFRFIKQSISMLINALRFLLEDQYSAWPLDKVVDAAPVDTAESAEVLEDENIASNTGDQKSVPASSAAVSGVVAIPVGDTIYNRDQAFNELRRIADYFNKTEPHSPVYMLLERAIRWGYMSLPDLLNEMVGENEHVMGRINQLAGLESIERTTIPAAQISAQEYQHRQQTEQPISEPKRIEMPVSSQESKVTPVSEPDNKEQESSAASSSGMSNFEW